MIYRGYRIVKALHPTALQPKRMTYDIKDVDGNVCKTNIASIATGQLIIDLMLKFGFWKDKSK